MGGDVGGALQRFHASIVHLLVAQARDFVAGKHNQLIALQFFEDGELGAHFLEEGVTLSGIAQAAGNAAAGVHVEMQLAFLSAKLGVIGFAPAFIFLDQFNVGVTRCGYLFNALFERKFFVDGP